MPQYDNIVIHGVFIDKPDGGYRYRLSVKVYPDNEVQIIEIPNSTTLNLGQVKKAIRDYYTDSGLKVEFKKCVHKRLSHGTGINNG